MKRLTRTTLSALILASFASGCSMPAMFSKTSKSKSDAAESQLAKTSKDLQDPISIHLSYAKWKEQIGDFPTATESYHLVLQKEPLNVEAQLGLARIALLNQNHAEAETKFREVLKQAPSDPNVLDQVAQFHAETGEWDRAAVLLESAVQIEPNNKDYRYHYAVALAQTGATQQSFHEFRHVMGEAESHYNIAYILHKTGNWSGAEQHLNYALRIQPDLVPARNLMAELLKDGGKEMQYVSHQSAPQTASAPRGQQPAAAPNRNAFHTKSDEGFFVPASGQAPPFPVQFEYSETRQPLAQ